MIVLLATLTTAGCSPDEGASREVPFPGSKPALTKLPLTEGIGAIWGAGASDIWAVGEAGSAVHFDGSRWVEHDTGTKQALHALHGTGPDDVWAAGEGILLHWDGQAWSSRWEDSSETFLGIWASGP
ncbi:MAG: hypothetical protein V9G22_15695 [Ottowia sp.]